MSTSSFSILSNPAPLDHERFSAHRELESLLRKSLRGPDSSSQASSDLVRFDLGSRALYAADASNYRQLPIGVVFPRDAADVEAALAACRATGAAVLPRGAGTSLAGQCVNVAVVFDYSRFMNSLEELDPVQRIARVQPGIVLDRLRDAAEVHHLTYAPDPATHSRCTLGGIIGNNSCGVHGLLGGKAVDNVESLDIVLYDGTRMTVGATPPAELDALVRSGGRVGQIYAGLARIRDRYAALVRERFPRIPRRVSGYNLDELLPENNFHVARALVGSEGTCANVVSATLNLIASPPFRVLTVLGFSDAFLAADAVPLALEHKPIGLEGFDYLLVDFMRRKGLALRDLDRSTRRRGFSAGRDGRVVPGRSAGQGRSHRPRLARLALPAGGAHLYAGGSGFACGTCASPLWAPWFLCPASPIASRDGKMPPCRPPSSATICAPSASSWPSTASAARSTATTARAACTPASTSTSPLQKACETFREFIDRAADVVLSFGGSLSGEHGDGQARAALLPKMFGPELMEAFREFKALWDPDNRMNPGKLSDAVRVYDPTENLRHAPATDRAPSNLSDVRQPRRTNRWKTHFAFAKDDGSLARATERCVGVGSCRNTEGGVMCPSYRATGEEQHSTRGRAHLLWEMLAGALREEGFQSRAVHEALDLCLSCKACKSECPVQVDMAAYKSEFLAQRYKGRLHPLHHYIFGFADKLARCGSLAPALTNAILTGPLTSPLIKRIAGVARERQLPRLAAENLPAIAQPNHKFWVPRVPSHLRTREAISGSPPQVSSFVARHLEQLLPSANPRRPRKPSSASAGFRVETPHGHICCGRPLYDFGLLGAAARSYLAQGSPPHGSADRCRPALHLS